MDLGNDYTQFIYLSYYGQDLLNYIPEDILMMLMNSLMSKIQEIAMELSGSDSYKKYLSKTLMVYGYSGSTAEDFANENGHQFVSLQ